MNRLTFIDDNCLTLTWALTGLSSKHSIHYKLHNGRNIPLRMFMCIVLQHFNYCFLLVLFLSTVYDPASRRFPLNHWIHANVVIMFTVFCLPSMNNLTVVYHWQLREFSCQYIYKKNFFIKFSLNLTLTIKLWSSLCLKNLNDLIIFTFLMKGQVIWNECELLQASYKHLCKVWTLWDDDLIISMSCIFQCQSVHLWR